MLKNHMNFNNKILLISGIILILFAIILFAGNVIAKDQGTKANDDSASYGKRGLTQNITYKGEDGNNYVLVVKNGLIVQTTQQENDQNNNSLWWNTSWDKRREISNLSGYSRGKRPASIWMIFAFLFFAQSSPSLYISGWISKRVCDLQPNCWIKSAEIPMPNPISNTSLSLPATIFAIFFIRGVSHLCITR